MKYKQTIIRDMEVMQVNNFNEDAIREIYKFTNEITAFSVNGKNEIKCNIPSGKLEVGDYICKIFDGKNIWTGNEAYIIKIFDKNTFEQSFKLIDENTEVKKITPDVKLTVVIDGLGFHKYKDAVKSYNSVNQHNCGYVDEEGNYHE